MKELERVIDGIWHWSLQHEGIGQPVHSYFLTDQRLAIDPIVDVRTVADLRECGGVERVALTNRHHLRGAARLVSEFGCEVVAPAPGMHEFSETDPEVTPYEWGEEIAEGVTTHEVGAICPDDGAFEIAVGPGVLALADGVIRWDEELAFVPDFLMDDPERVKRTQLEALERLLELDFDAVLLAHGEPIPSGGKERIREFVESPRSADFSG